MIDPGLERKVVLITGANHGIGAAAARAFAAQGARVFVTYFREPCRYGEKALEEAREAGIGGVLFYWAVHRQPADQVIQDIVAQGGVVAGREADLGDPANIRLVFDECEAVLGPVDVLINNHTHSLHDTFDPATVTVEGYGIGLISGASIDGHFAVNARAYALMMSEYIQRYLSRQARRGRIINVSTDAAHAHAGSLSTPRASTRLSPTAAPQRLKSESTASPSTLWHRVRSRAAGSRLSRRLPFPPALHFAYVACPRT